MHLKASSAEARFIEGIPGLIKDWWFNIKQSNLVPDTDLKPANWTPIKKLTEAS